MDDNKKQKIESSNENSLKTEEIDEKKQEKTQKKGKIKLEDLEEKVRSLEDQLKRAVADYRNLENRVQEERIEFIKFANKNLLESLLPAFDTLLLAEKYTEDENFKVTVKHVLDVLKNAGIERIETVGNTFNPESMEAVEVISGEEGKVIEETQPGFTLGGRVIRPARVKVGGNKEGVK